MPDSSPILKTKFFLPQLTSDFVDRRSLHSKFEALNDVQIMLVSAATGYGKSTLVSAYLREQDKDFAWLSLSENDTDFSQFMTYFTLAVKSCIKNFGSEITDIMRAPELPSVDLFAAHAINGFVELKELFFLVLDDYHYIRNKDIHRFIGKLFEYPQPFFRLILITRRDPELPLSWWRSLNQLVEIRASDLRLSREEILEFLMNAVGFKPDDHILERIEEVTDGWISGLRLLILSSSDKEVLQQHFIDYSFKDSHILSQLIEAILRQQHPSTRDQLLRISILEEFNIDLFSELCLSGNDKLKEKELFEEFINRIVRSNLFIIALDDRHNWYRFHHLFRDLLRKYIDKEYSIKEINSLKVKAAHWYTRNNQPDESIELFLVAGREEQAIESFTGLRNELLSAARWQRLERNFKHFPESIVETNAMLGLTRAWLYIFSGNIPEMAGLLPGISRLLKIEAQLGADNHALLGELNTMKAYVEYSLKLNMKACHRYAAAALGELDGANIYAVGLAWIFLGGALQALNRSGEAKRIIYSELENQSHPNLKSNLYLTLCYINWLDGDLNDLVTSANHLIRLGVQAENKEARANGQYFAGIAHYFLNQPLKALVELEEFDKLKHFTLLVHRYFGITALAFLHLEFKNLSGMSKLLEEMEIMAIEKGGLLYIQFTKAIRSTLHWIKDKDPAARIWAIEQDPAPSLPMTNFTAIPLLQSYILATDHNVASWIKAKEVLFGSIEFLRKMNNTHFLIRAYAILTIVHFQLNETKAATDILRKTLILAESRGMIRPFLAHRDRMFEILKRAGFKKEQNAFIDKLIELTNPNKTDHKSSTVLTSREVQIIKLFEDNLSNKEIGSQLFISEKTVKRHIANLYKKINASNRREALSLAREKDLI